MGVSCAVTLRLRACQADSLGVPYHGKKRAFLSMTTAFFVMANYKCDPTQQSRREALDMAWW